jgi:hypothetical protein
MAADPAKPRLALVLDYRGHGQSEYERGASDKADTRTGDRPLQARLQPRLMWVSPPACCAPILGLALQGPVRSGS